MSNKTTAAEAADRIAEHYRIHFAKEGERAHFITEALKMAVSVLRRVASGEYAPVVHAEWLNFYGDFSTAECEKCGEIYEVSPDEKPREDYFNAFKQFYKYCPSCGALMDGKDDSHEAD